MGDSLAALEDLYIFLTSNLAALQAACPVDPQRSELMSLYVAARRNYWQCIDVTMHDDDPALVSLVAQMKTQQSVITHEVLVLNDVAKLLNDLTTAVQIGTKIAALAG
jgi:hypothetical protein